VKNPLDSAELQAAIERVHHAGMPGVVAEVRDGGRIWRGAAGVADVATGRPITAGMRHRVGSISKTFTAAAILQQVEGGRIGLDTPIGHYLPRLLPGERGDAITVRMLINHTSGLADYLPYAFPSLKAFPSLRDTTPESLEENRLRRFHRSELIDMGVTVPAAGAPGGTPGVYSNTTPSSSSSSSRRSPAARRRNTSPRTSSRGGLRDTGFPAGLHVDGPHSLAYEAWSA
jgi:D-alanyl-D-alanine carboxypeptidase